MQSMLKPRNGIKALVAFMSEKFDSYEIVSRHTLCDSSIASPYLCDNLDTILTEFHNITHVSTIMYFPEFAALLPEGKDYYGAWWHINDYKSRLECLDKCIVLTSNPSHGYTEGADIWPEFPPKETNHIK